MVWRVDFALGWMGVSWAIRSTVEVFISSYMVLAPVFGYLGDRYNRKYLMCGGIAFWSLVTLGSSFIPREQFWLLLLTRGLVGVGEASYSTIAPTLIADLFVADQRSRMLSVFYFAIPVGSGLGYIAGSKVKDMAGDWHWALRANPCSRGLANSSVG
ncbi:protein spinster homolog 1 [Puma concolor]|uniref:Protein spinster homolog 1 n=1 Tax=Puma concolor TaxID=9696 RepID=A0A6P6HJ95_PUMCO|nr:protein spinster homolog 1 [Puma concolor]